MLKPSSTEVTKLLLEWRLGNQEALDELMPIVYEELRRQAHRYMQREQKGHSLQTTALINETYLRLLDCSKMDWKNRAHFFAISAHNMRRILVDYARSHSHQKRGGGLERISLAQSQISLAEQDPDLVALDDALNSLAAEDNRKCKVVELRFFGGLSVEETAEALGISSQSVMRDWKLAKLWLARELTNSAVDGP